MNQTLRLSFLFLSIFFNAQLNSNRFLYEFTITNKDSAKNVKIITILDISDKKSFYQDYTLIERDSITKLQIQEMQKNKQFGDISKVTMNPKFSYKIEKKYPTFEIRFTELIMSMDAPFRIAYNENPKFNWKILKEKQQIGTYKTQKATTTFGGRNWIAWFSTELPFQDGPYKFHGLPGLIVKIEDAENNFSWELKGNATINDFSEMSYIEKLQSGGNMRTIEMTKEKFEKTYSEFIKDPFGSIRGQIPASMLNQKMPGSNSSVGDMISSQEKNIKNMYNLVNYPIELK
jgi:GLPGLI family protein